jgi:hypothetical protein
MRSEMIIMRSILDVQSERDTYRAEIRMLLDIPYRYRSKEAQSRIDRLTSCIISCNESVDFLKRELNTYR